MQAVPDWTGPFDPNNLPAELLTSDRPCVVRGGFAHWPVVQAARQSDEALARYLMGLYNGVRIGLFQLAPEARGLGGPRLVGRADTAGKAAQGSGD